jgi:hypothetical protein
LKLKQARRAIKPATGIGVEDITFDRLQIAVQGGGGLLLFDEASRCSKN